MVVAFALSGSGGHKRAEQTGCAAGPLETELSMVQIEQMRVISPDDGKAAELSYREEQLKYALLGEGSAEASAMRRAQRSCSQPAPAPVCWRPASASGMPRS